MRWAIVFLPAARKDFLRLDPAVAKQVARRLKALEKDPLRAMKRLKGSPNLVLRVGDHRLICRPADEAKPVLIIRRIGHRSVVYDA